MSDLLENFLDLYSTAWVLKLILESFAIGQIGEPYHEAITFDLSARRATEQSCNVESSTRDATKGLQDIGPLRN